MSDPAKPKAELMSTIKGLGNVCKARGFGFDALNALGSVGARIIGLRDLAYARMEDEYLTNDGSYVMEGTIYAMKSPPLFVSKSPIVDPLQAAPRNRKAGKPFYVDPQSYLEKAEEDKKKEPQDRDVLILKRPMKEGLAIDINARFSIPANRFGEDELTLWAFKDQAGEYGLFLKDHNIDGINIWVMNEKYVTGKKPFARQLSLLSRDYGLGISDGSGLDEGRCRNTYGITATNKDELVKVEAYTPRQLIDALDFLELNGLREQLFSALEKD